MGERERESARFDEKLSLLRYNVRNLVYSEVKPNQGKARLGEAFMGLIFIFYSK